MSFRVYDKKRKKWVNNNILLTSDGELVRTDQSILGGTKLTFISQDRYVYQKSIDLQDKNGVSIYIGDYIEAQVASDKTVVGLVTYANELSAYIILCFDTDEYYTLGNEIRQYIKVVGNVFDEFFDVSKKGKKDDNKPLQKQKT